MPRLTPSGTGDSGWRREPFGDGVGAIIIEAHAVDERLVAGQAKEAGTRIAGLGMLGDRANLDEAEAERRQRGNGARVFIEARRQPDGVRKAQTKDRSWGSQDRRAM